MRINAVVSEQVRLVQKYERVQFSSQSFVFAARRFAPRPISPHRVDSVEVEHTNGGGNHSEE